MAVSALGMYGIHNKYGRRVLRREAEALEATRAGYEVRGLISAKDWYKAQVEIKANGDLFIGGHHVMADWELPYVNQLAKFASKRGGKVLELGFGSGISAAQISRAYTRTSNRVTEHVIIEGHPKIALMAHGFANYCNRHFPGVRVRVIEGMWQDQGVIDQLDFGTFDGVLYDCYPTTSFEVMNQIGTFCVLAHRLLRKGGAWSCYSDRVDTYTDTDVAALMRAGFIADSAHLRGRVMKVSPPKGTEYCNVWHLLAPEIIK